MSGNPEPIPCCSRSLKETVNFMKKKSKRGNGLLDQPATDKEADRGFTFVVNQVTDKEAIAGDGVSKNQKMDTQDDSQSQDPRQQQSLASRMKKDKPSVDELEQHNYIQRRLFRMKKECDDLDEAKAFLTEAVKDMEKDIEWLIDFGRLAKFAEEMVHNLDTLELDEKTGMPVEVDLPETEPFEFKLPHQKEETSTEMDVCDTSNVTIDSNIPVKPDDKLSLESHEKNAVSSSTEMYCDDSNGSSEESGISIKSDDKLEFESQQKKEESSASSEMECDNSNGSSRDSDSGIFVKPGEKLDFVSNLGKGESSASSAMDCDNSNGSSSEDSGVSVKPDFKLEFVSQQEQKESSSSRMEIDVSNVCSGESSKSNEKLVREVSERSQPQPSQITIHLRVPNVRF